MGASNRYGIGDADQSTINTIRPWLLRIDKGYIHCGVQVQGVFSKIRRIFDSIISVMTAADQGPGW